jgi:hypothetical protein
LGDVQARHAGGRGFEPVRPRRLIRDQGVRQDPERSGPAPAVEFWNETERPIFAVVAIRIVFAEDSYLVREGVRRLLEDESDIELVEICENLDLLLDRVGQRTG